MTHSATFDTLREHFPVRRHMLYLDAAHQTPLATPVRQALDAFYLAAHLHGGPKPVWLRRVEQVRARVAAFLGALPGEIAFTKNTSEGLNIAANALGLTRGDKVLLIEGDHPNNAYAWLNLVRQGVEVQFIPLRRGVADAALFAPHMDARTRAVSLSHVTFHAGHRHDIAGIGALCRERGVPMVVDAMQSAGVVPIDVKAMGISILAAGCHKGLLVPQGLGLLYVDHDLSSKMRPAYLALSALARPPADLVADPSDLGLREDAGRFETGNYNLPDIHALEAALDLIESVGVAGIEDHVLALGDRLIERMDALGVALVGPRERARRAHIYVLALPTQPWLEYLTGEGVRVSPERDGIRVSFGLFNTADDVDRFAQLVEAGLRTRALA
ncbi:aminotransferase class V-fold PLP-dependent enzyme [Achromobacter sp. Marseille-Q0513]|uniref:aminotransferase class V-fold PLP-dependent enzyme n=1 Tax=Achromobacter sp. Marseille-Q0513 TaxID=2829161 RepID=UPI001BA2E51C|nr:aminotransferase class V-fold PLP-dependent enzyme [Achromobacter sp. Marseille-Q0513]MBR8653658.1 aminotransferase class V-fold PLP-dependent enzyme [Achromobacter sp. Marseille-Q0513]